MSDSLAGIITPATSAVNEFDRKRAVLERINQHIRMLESEPNLSPFQVLMRQRGRRYITGVVMKELAPGVTELSFPQRR